MSLAIALGAGILAFAAMGFMARARADVAAALERARQAESALGDTQRLTERVRTLTREVETLSAIREVALIANDDVSFERILTDVLGIVADLVGGSTLSIHLASERTGALEPRALWQDGEARVLAATSTAGTASGGGGGVGLAIPAADLAIVAEAFTHRRSVRREEEGALTFAVLLYADAEVGGVLHARVPAEGRSKDELLAIEPALVGVSKHVALAIQKPTLYDKAVVDALTRLYTKRHFTAQLARMCALGKRSARPFALVLVDIDRFKSVNDTHGHLTGDLVLAEVAAVIARTARETDLCFRYGGEEMAILAPESDLAAARVLAERCRAAIEAAPLKTAAGAPLRATASFGVSVYGQVLAGAPLGEPQALVAAADHALYASKANGRNRVTAAGEEPPKPASKEPAAGEPKASKAAAKGEPKPVARARSGPASRVRRGGST